MEQLKPCPFCGGKASINKFEHFGRIFYTITCDECEIAKDEEYLTEKEVIEAWNKRFDN